MKPLYKKLIWFLLTILFVFLALNRRSRDIPFTYHSTLMSDAAGYYVYVPATFLYHFKANAFPDSIDIKTGFGFRLNQRSNKLESKYPIGTAIFQTIPFAVTHLYLVLFHQAGTGFEIPYQNAILVFGVLLFLLSLYLLFIVFKAFYEAETVALGLILLVAGSNLFYYGLFMAGMSHIYSFFLFSAWLYLWQKIANQFRWRYWMGMIAVAALVLLVRQLNIVFLPLVFLIIPNSFPLLRKLRFKHWGIAFLTGGLFLLPQLAYNIYLHESLFAYSYQGEGFTHYKNPKFLEVWVGPENGFLSTNPIHLFTLMGFILVGIKSPKQGSALWLGFLVLSYIYAAWWAYLLGCSYGHRGFVDLYPYFALGLIASVNTIKQKSNLVKNLCYFIYFLFVAFNIKLIYTFDACWPNPGNHWDWATYFEMIFKAI